VNNCSVEEGLEWEVSLSSGETARVLPFLVGVELGLAVLSLGDTVIELGF